MNFGLGSDYCISQLLSFANGAHKIGVDVYVDGQVFRAGQWARAAERPGSYVTCSIWLQRKTNCRRVCVSPRAPSSSLCYDPLAMDGIHC